MVKMKMIATTAAPAMIAPMIQVGCGCRRREGSEMENDVIREIGDKAGA
jgi:hypothetical protein